MFEGHEATILEAIHRRRGLAPESLRLLEETERRTGRSVVRLALEHGLIDRAEVVTAVAKELGWEALTVPPETLDPSLVPLLPAELARACRAVPWRRAGPTLEVLLVDPFDLTLAGQLVFALQCDVRVVVADPDRVTALLDRFYPAEGAGHRDGGVASVHSDPSERGAVEEPPVIQYVDTVLCQAIRERASDVHFEPFEETFRIRFRVDGTLREVAHPPRPLAQPVISRLKVMAGLDIAEHRVPQDGRLAFDAGGRPFDLRISTLPTQFGESVVLRVLDRTTRHLALDALGLPAPIAAGLREVIGRPSGILIVTGPTGSGKTTTLYSALRAIDRPTRKLLTVEDPVEYELDGVMQVAVQPVAGVSFASVLRSFLRQDPDVIMIGEIRDLETAQIAIQAALTGHFVLTTLHTNDAPSAIARLVDLGIEPYLIASTVEAVLAQRLVRRVCATCAGTGGACAACGGTGFRGRFGVFEWLPMSESLREAVAARAPLWELRELAVQTGLRPLRGAGLEAAEAGLTTRDEVLLAC